MNYKFTAVLLLILILLLCLLIRYSRETFQLNNSHTETILTFFENLDKKRGVFYSDGKPIKPQQQQLPLLQPQQQQPVAAAARSPATQFTVTAKSRGGGGGKAYSAFFIKYNNVTYDNDDGVMITKTDGSAIDINLGYNIVVLNADGTYANSSIFNTLVSYDNTTAMIDFIKNDIQAGMIVCAAIFEEGANFNAPSVILYQHGDYGGYERRMKANADGSNKFYTASARTFPKEDISSFKIPNGFKLKAWKDDDNDVATVLMGDYTSDISWLGANNDKLSAITILKTTPDILTTNEALRLIGGLSSSNPFYRSAHAIVGVKGWNAGTAADIIIHSDEPNQQGHRIYTTDDYATATNTFTIPSNNTPQNIIRYGDVVKIKHIRSEQHLYSHARNAYHDGTPESPGCTSAFGYHEVTCSDGTIPDRAGILTHNNANYWWLIEGGLNGAVINYGDRIALRHKETGLYVKLDSNYVISEWNQAFVGCHAVPTYWILEEGNGSIELNSSIKLKTVIGATPYLLHSHGGALDKYNYTCPASSGQSAASGQQHVTGVVNGNANSVWKITEKQSNNTPPVETTPYTKIADKGARKVQNCPHLLNITGQTLETCKKLCTDDEKCTTFNMIGGHCNLKSCVSCNSPNDPNCNLTKYVDDNIEIWGNNRTKIHYTKIKGKGERKSQNCPHLWGGWGQTLESCKKLCNDDEKCTTFNFRDIGGNCNLKSCVSCNSPTDPKCKLKNYDNNNIEIWGNNRTKIHYTKITNKGDQKVQNCPVIAPWTGGQTLESCKKLCTDDPRCTTFNMIGGDCNRKACEQCNRPNDSNCKLTDYYSDDIEIWGNNR